MEELIKEAQERFQSILDLHRESWDAVQGMGVYRFPPVIANIFIKETLTEARKKWLEEEILKLKKCLSGQKIDYGHDCYDHACRYCENAVIDITLEDQISRLESELKALDK